MIEAIMAGFALGALSIPHCAIMCGPFVAVAYQGQNSWLGLVSHHWSRIATYAILAAFWINLDLSTSARGAFAVAAGLALLGAVRSHAKACPGGCTSHQRNALPRRLAKYPFVAGMVQGLIPCATSATAIVAALAWGNMAQSLAFIVMFGIMTTVPFVTVHIRQLGHVINPINQWIHKHRIPLMVVLGCWMMFRGSLGLLGPDLLTELAPGVAKLCAPIMP